MSRYKISMTIALTVAGVILLIGLTYIIPMILLRSTEKKAVINSENALSTPAFSERTPSQDSDEVGPVIVIQPFHRVVTSEGKRELEIKASRATIDQKSRMFNLEAVDEIVFWGETDEKVTVSADTGIWDQQRSLVRVEDNVRALIETPDRESIDVSVQWLEYDNELAQLEGGNLVTIVHGPYTASGNRIKLRQHINHVELEDSVHVAIEPKAFKTNEFIDETVTIECGLLQYAHKDQILQFDKGPVIKAKKSTMAALKITLFTETDNIRIVWSKDCLFTIFLPDNDVPVVIKAEEITFDQKAGALSMLKSITVEHEDQVITASDQLHVMLNPETEDILGAQASGNVNFKATEISGSADSLLWNALSEIVILQGNAALQNNADNHLSADLIQLQMANAFYSAEGNVNVEFGSDRTEPSGEPAGSFLLGGFTSNSSEKSETTLLNADVLEVDEQRGHAYFKGNVHGNQGTASFSMEELDIRFDPEKRQMKDMTARNSVVIMDQDRLLTSNYLYYNATTGNTEVLQNPVLWHGETQIRADRFDTNDIDKTLRMTGHIEAVAMVGDSFTMGKISSPESSVPEDRVVHLTAGKGFYDEATGRLEFEDDVIMRMEDWVVRSETTQLYFDDKTGQLLGMDALGNIQIKHPLFDATGHSLTYSPETSILVLRGTDTEKCRVIQGERGTEGEVVRFFVDENRFAIEKGVSVIMPSEIVETTR